MDQCLNSPENHCLLTSLSEFAGISCFTDFICFLLKNEGNELCSEEGSATESFQDNPNKHRDML